LQALGHTARIVVSDDLLGGRAVAIWSPASSPFPRWLAPGALPMALAVLPIQALGLPPSVEESFCTLGVDTVEALAKLPAAAIRDRFGTEASRAHARARGCFAFRRLPVLSEHPPFWRQESLPFPAETVEAVGFIVHRLLGSLCEELDEHQMSATRVELSLALEDGAPRILRFRTGRRTRDVGVLSRLLRCRLEGVRLDGAVCSVTLSLPGVQSFDGEQPHLLDRGTAAEAVPELLARLGDTLGVRAVSSPRDQQRWRPEAAWAPCALLEPSPDPRTALDRSKDPVWPHERWRAGRASTRPILLLPEARPVQVYPERGRPRRVCIEGRWLEVVRVCALEELSGEWWSDAFERTYLALGLSDGRWAWVYRAWGHVFLHGWFDQGGPLEPPQES
jgi:protein ImuB